MYLQAETEFGLNFLNTLPANESVVFSPISIALALAILHVGARGNSRDQIRNVLLNGTTHEQFVDHFSFMNKNIKQSRQQIVVDVDWVVNDDEIYMVTKNRTIEMEVLVANRVYVKDKFPIKPEFLTTSRDRYNTDAVTFSSVPAVVNDVNSFVNEATKGKIAKIVERDMLGDCVSLVINAIYFKGDWKAPFDERGSKDKNFTTVSGELKEMKFMIKKEETLYYSSDETFDVLHLEYDGEEFRFSVFLPKVKNSLNQALKMLDAEKFQRLMQEKYYTLMNVDLPKFKTETTINTLPNNLANLGLTDIFNATSADLTGMANATEAGGNVFVSGGIHKAIIEVDEKGTVAAAITLMMQATGSCLGCHYEPPKPKDFIANHPFLYALSYQNHPLFMGVFHK